MTWLLKKNTLVNVLILFFLIAIYLAASWGNSYVSVIQPRQLLLQWEINKKPFSEKHWQAAVTKMDSIVASNANNTQYLTILAGLYERAAYQKPIWHNEARVKRSNAIKYYKATLKLRPTWSAAWADLAMSKTLNIEFGDEVKVALSNALKYGVWEPGVFHKILWISIANWNALPTELKQQVEDKIKQTVNQKGQVPLYIEQTATHFNWQDTLQIIVDAKVNE